MSPYKLVAIQTVFSLSLKRPAFPTFLYLRNAFSLNNSTPEAMPAVFPSAACQESRTASLFIIPQLQFTLLQVIHTACMVCIENAYDLCPLGVALVLDVTAYTWRRIRMFLAFAGFMPLAFFFSSHFPMLGKTTLVPS